MKFEWIHGKYKFFIPGSWFRPDLESWKPVRSRSHALETGWTDLLGTLPEQAIGLLGQDIE